MRKNGGKISFRATSAMRKLCATVFVAACLALLATLLASCDKSKDEPLFQAPIYDINMTYDSATHTISARQEILLFSPAATFDDELLFHLYPNAFSSTNDAINILSVKINRQNADFEICGDDNSLLRIALDCADELVNVSMEYDVELSETAQRLGYAGECASLCHFYPVLAVYDEGWHTEPYSEFGDPFFSECSDFYVTLTLDGDLAVAASGEALEGDAFERDGKLLKTVEISAQNVRDFGLVVGPYSFQKAPAHMRRGDVDVYYFYLSDPSPSNTLSRAVSAIETFGAAFGDYPYPAFTFVQSELDGAGGMEYGAFATISPAPQQQYLDAVTHEIAHQWWYGAVGNDQLRSGWMDEGLSEFCTYYYFKLAGDGAEFSRAMADISASYKDFVAVMRPAGFDASMQRPLSSYISNGEYVAVNYQKGALLFYHLFEIVGEKKFNAALAQYFADNKFSIATPDALCAAFKTQGFDIAPILNGWINCKEF